VLRIWMSGNGMSTLLSMGRGVDQTRCEEGVAVRMQTVAIGLKNQLFFWR